MEEKSKSRGIHNQQVGRAGEYFVVAELNKRGAYAVPFAGNMPNVDLIACNHDQSRTVHIQVKTKLGTKTWQSSTKGSQPTSQKNEEDKFWVFVDLGNIEEPPRFWIVPDWWLTNDIYTTHKAYLLKHGGKRPKNPDSTHHAINENRLSEWFNRWDLLGIVN